MGGDGRCDRFLSGMGIGGSRGEDGGGSRLGTGESLKLLQPQRDGTPCGSRSGSGSDKDADKKMKG